MSKPIEAILTEIEARAKAALPGPWVDYMADGNSTVFREVTAPGDTEQNFSAICDFNERGDWKTPAFVAHARTDVPRLVAALRVAVEALEQLGAEETVEKWPELETYTRIVEQVAKDALSAITKELTEKERTGEK